MPKIYLTAAAKSRIVREVALWRKENPDAPETFSDDLKADIAEMEKNQGQDMPAGAVPGPAFIQFPKCKIAFQVRADELLIDTSETIYAPRAGILRPS